MPNIYLVNAVKYISSKKFKKMKEIEPILQFLCWYTLAKTLP